jgi:hypothetical protein
MGHIPQQFHYSPISSFLRLFVSWLHHLPRLIPSISPPLITNPHSLRQRKKRGNGKLSSTWASLKRSLPPPSHSSTPPNSILLQCGDVEENPGPINVINNEVFAAPDVVNAFVRDAKATGDWVTGNLGTTGLAVIATTWAENKVGKSNPEMFVAAMTRAWVACFGVKVPIFLPDIQVPDITTELKKWCAEQSPDLLDAVRRDCDLEASDDPPSKSCKPLPTSSPSSPPGWNLRCRVNGCNRLFLTSSAIANHLNFQHAGSQCSLGLAERMGISQCGQCNSWKPSSQKCVPCLNSGGRVTTRLRGRPNSTTLGPAPTPDPLNPFLRSLLAASVQSTSHIPPAAVGRFAELFSLELVSFAKSPTSANMERVLAAPKILLARGHGGKRRSKGEERRRFELMELWAAGDAEVLWRTMVTTPKRREKNKVKNTPTNESTTLSTKVIGSLVSLTRQGLAGKAVRLLISRGIADWDTETTAAIHKLFPASTSPTIPSYHSDGDDFSTEEVADAIKRLGRGKAPGPSGLRPEHIRDILSNPMVGDSFLDALTKFVNAVAFGRAPDEVAGLLCAGRVVPLRKKDGGIRPLVVGETLRNLVAICWLGRVGTAFENSLEPRHLGLGRATGVENAVHAAKLQRKAMKHTDALLKIDFKNAYNAACRNSIVQAVETHCEELTGWAAWTLRQPTVLGAGDDTVTCASGVQQGDPLSPLLFSALMAELATAVDLEFNTPGRGPLISWQQWYLDDGLFLVKVDDVAEVLSKLQAMSAKVGLALNRAKCELLCNHPQAPAIATATLVDLVKENQWSYLGCPLSDAPEDHPSFQSALRNIEKLAETIAQVDCPEAQLAMWRQSMGACRVQHLTATCKASETNALASKVSHGIRGGLENILSSPVTDEAFKQATLPVRHGGLGLQDPSSTNAAAHLCSLSRLPQKYYIHHKEAYGTMRAEAAWQLANRMGLPPEETLKWVDDCEAKGNNSLHNLCDKVHKNTRSQLIHNATLMGRRRLTSVGQNHAGAWTLGPGKCTPLPNSHFRAGLHWYLGLHVCSRTSTCECGRPADPLGVHFTQCRFIDRRVHCHNQLRDTVAQSVRDAGMAVQVEACAPGERTRPGDILVPGWRNGKPVAVDFAIVTAHNASEPDLTATRKHQKYDEKCTAAGWDFVAAVTDTYGGILGEGQKFLAALCKAQAEKLGKGYPAPQEVFWKSVSTAVIWRAAGAIAAAWAKGATPEPGEASDPGPSSTSNQTPSPSPSPSTPHQGPAGTPSAQPQAPVPSPPAQPPPKEAPQEASMEI